jgi:hypothetical protein
MVLTDRELEDIRKLYGKDAQQVEFLYKNQGGAYKDYNTTYTEMIVWDDTLRVYSLYPKLTEDTNFKPYTETILPGAWQVKKETNGK